MFFVRENARVVVLSDLHAVVDPDDVRMPALNYAHGSSARSLLQMCALALKERYPDGLDLLLVAGDMTDKASGGSLKLVWEDLNWLAHELDVPMVATSGNHDYDSRATETPLPYESLFDLQPPFPFGDSSTRDKYFAQQHAVYCDDNFLVISANSAAHHGYAVDGEQEHLHGRFAKSLPARMRETLSGIDSPPPVRILLTHHHLSQLPSFDLEEGSSSIGYDDVLEVISEFGSWIVVHGHKHRGYIQYANGGGDAPPLISASAFSADFGGGSFAQKVRHQFHVIEIPKDIERSLLDISGAHGSVTSWTHSRVGWSVAPATGELPGESGFGWKTSLHALAQKLRDELLTRVVLDEADLESFEPRMKYLAFSDQRRLLGYLDIGTPRVRAILTSEGRVRELSLMTGAAN